MTTLVRSDALRNYMEMATELGGDAHALLRKAHIPVEALRTRDTFVSFRSMLNLLELSAEALQCSDFAIRLAVRQGVEIFGPIALAAQNCETVGAAVECFSQYFHTHNPGLQITASHKPSSRTTQIGFRVLLPRPPAHPQFNERCIALAHGVLTLLSPSGYRPQRVLLPHGRLSPLKIYRDHFGCDAVFDQPAWALEVATSDMRRALPAHNPQLHMIATSFLEKMGAKPNALLSVRVREAIKPLLATGSGSHGDLAEVLHIHARTLQRRLAEEGTSFEIIKDEVRREMARHYLSTSTIPLSQITALLGYSEQSALTRSCWRWFGRKPLVLRRESLRP